MSNVWRQVDEAESQGKAVILMNPVLKDIPSAAGVMGVRSALLFFCLLCAYTPLINSLMTCSALLLFPCGLSLLLSCLSCAFLAKFLSIHAARF